MTVNVSPWTGLVTSPPCHLRRRIGAATAIILLAVPTVCRTVEAQSLPPVVVESNKKQPKAAPKAATKAPTTAPAAQPAAAPTGQLLALDPAATPPGGSLTVPTTAQAEAMLSRIPGSVVVGPDTVFRNSPANTVKDVLGWVPGVIVQPRWGPDGRLSIRGSGLSRNYGNRGINMYMDGIPINTADGLFDLFEIDPSAYRYVEVYKGANALRYGANALGGAINFVTPTGRDASPFDSACRRRQLRVCEVADEFRRGLRAVGLFRQRYQRNARTGIASTTRMTWSASTPTSATSSRRTPRRAST